METVLIEKRRFLRFPELWQAGLLHAFSTADLNLQIRGRQDSPELLPDFRLAFSAIPKENREFYYMVQRHSDQLLALETEGLGEEIFVADSEGTRRRLGRRIDQVDGLATEREDFLLASAYADCVPLLFYDPLRRVQANVHSGWRGSLARIGENAVELLRGRYGARAENILVAIGPHIGRDDFEVEEDVAPLFSERFPELEALVRRKDERKYLVDLGLCIREGLRAKGILPEHIYQSPYSTVGEKELLHSFRRDRDAFGMMFVFSQLR